MRGARLPVATGVAVIALIAAGAVVGATTMTAKTIRGTARANTLRGTAAADAIYGLGGNDKLYGGAGNDRLYGGAGDDLLVAGPGADTLSCGPGNDTAVGDAKDKASADCEHVRGILKTGGGGPPPPAACSNGKDDDGDGLTDYPNDPGCESALDSDETDEQPPPPPPPPPIQAGTYCGYTDQGPGLCVTTDGQSVTKFETAAIVDCTDGSRWTWTVTFGRSGGGVQVAADGSFSFQYSGPLTTSSTTVTNLQESEFIKGSFTPDGKATGTLAITSISWDENGTHYACTQGAVGWHVTRQ